MIFFYLHSEAHHMCGAVIPLRAFEHCPRCHFPKQFLASQVKNTYWIKMTLCQNYPGKFAQCNNGQIYYCKSLLRISLHGLPYHARHAVDYSPPWKQKLEYTVSVFFSPFPAGIGCDKFSKISYPNMLNRKSIILYTWGNISLNITLEFSRCGVGCCFFPIF